MIDRIKSDLLVAMKQRDTTTVATLRMLISQVQYARIDLKRDLEEKDYVAILQRAVKTRREAIEQYEKGGRPERADQERSEITVVERYLPAQMGEAEVARAVDALLKELGLTSKKDLGRAMKEFMERHRGRVNGKMVNALIASRLS
ncbi:MAG: GatB/YqeY domain-containing protein [Acidobacteria bacterium]|nr:GatB/YqeY domain-containing protein [Acidobacteriota bacterium]